MLSQSPQFVIQSVMMADAPPHRLRGTEGPRETRELLFCTNTVDPYYYLHAPHVHYRNMYDTL